MISISASLCSKGYDSSFNPIGGNNDSYTSGSFDDTREFSSNICHSYLSHRHCGEVSLFRAVIMQALLDSVNNSKRMEDILEKRKAVKWFNLDDEDFIYVCKLANFSPVWVLEKAKVAIQKGCKWRAGL